jgi:hypothetical protein
VPKSRSTSDWAAAGSLGQALVGGGVVLEALAQRVVLERLDEVVDDAARGARPTVSTSRAA